MKKKFIKVLSFIFVFLFLVAAVPLSASAGVTDAGENIATSDVLTDLERFGIDITQYQKDLDAKHCRMLNFLEYGYSYHTVASDYGLYVYMWNPTGKVIQTDGKNYIQMQLLDSKGNSIKGFSKYPLEYVSHSTNEGYEHLFYKFRVGSINGFQSTLEKAMRRYDISGVELHFNGNTNATESGVSAIYSFTGYMSYRGADTSVRNTLTQHVTDRITQELELHGTTWKTSTSDKGVDYAYEVFSVYFSVPNDIIEDYGDKNDATKGLVEVDGEFSEYKVNGIVTDSTNAYNLVYGDLGKNYKNNDVGFKFVTRELTSAGGSGGIGVRYNFNGVSGYFGLEAMNAAHSVYYSDRFKDETLLSQNEFLDAFNDLREELGLFYSYSKVDDGRTTGKQSYTIKDTDNWGESIASYADTSRGKFWEWISGRGNLFEESKDYGSIKAIEVVTSDKVSDVLKDEYIAETLFIDQNDVSNLRSFVISETLKNNTVYLMRFAVCDYYCSPIVFMEKDALIDTIEGEHYFFEKTIFLDFDILTFTWENEYEQRTIIPVVTSPIDIIGSVTKPTEPGFSGVIKDTIEDIAEKVNNVGEFFAKFKTMFLLIAGLLVLALVVWILSKFGILSLIGKLFLGVFRGIGSLFGFTERRVDKHRERKEHNEDRAWKKEEEERKRSEEKRKNDRHDWDKYDQDQKKKEDGWRDDDRKRSEKQRKEKESARKSEEALNRFNAKVFNDEAHKKTMKRGENDKKKKK